MKIKAEGPGAHVDVRDRCGWLRLTATFEEEEELLSLLYRCLVAGGGPNLVAYLRSLHDAIETARQPQRRRQLRQRNSR